MSRVLNIILCVFCAAIFFGQEAVLNLFPKKFHLPLLALTLAYFLWAILSYFIDVDNQIVDTSKIKPEWKGSLINALINIGIIIGFAIFGLYIFPYFFTPHGVPPE